MGADEQVNQAQPGPAPAAAPRTSGLAIASLVAGALGLCTVAVGSIVGIILGAVSLRRIRAGGGRVCGRGLAIAGIIVSVASLVAWVAAGVIGALAVMYIVRWEEKSAETRQVIAQIETALDMYELEVGHYPNDAEGGLRALVEPPPATDPASARWRGPYVRQPPLDAWGRDLNFEPLPSSSGRPYRVWSLGPDGESGTWDDVWVDPWP